MGRSNLGDLVAWVTTILPEVQVSKTVDYHSNWVIIQLNIEKIIAVVLDHLNICDVRCCLSTSYPIWFIDIEKM